MNHGIQDKGYIGLGGWFQILLRQNESWGWFIFAGESRLKFVPRLGEGDIMRGNINKT